MGKRNTLSTTTRNTRLRSRFHELFTTPKNTSTTSTNPSRSWRRKLCRRPAKSLTRLPKESQELSTTQRQRRSRDAFQEPSSRRSPSRRRSSSQSLRSRRRTTLSTDKSQLMKQRPSHSRSPELCHTKLIRPSDALSTTPCTTHHPRPPARRSMMRRSTGRDRFQEPSTKPNLMTTQPSSHTSRRLTLRFRPTRLKKPPTIDPSQERSSPRTPSPTNIVSPTRNTDTIEYI